MKKFLIAIFILFSTIGGSMAQTICSTITLGFDTIQNGKTIQFLPTGLPNVNATFVWTFGDGKTANNQSPAHTYTASGSYPVCLTVTIYTPNTPMTNCSVTYCDTVNITKPACTTSASFTTTVTGRSVSFSGSTSTVGSGNYYWLFGDGTSASGQNVNHTFAAPGKYNVCLYTLTSSPNAPYDSCTAYVCDSILVASQPCTITANYTYSKSLRSVSFTGNGTGGAQGQYLWNFGDGTTGTGKKATHVYSSSGAYNVCLSYYQIKPNQPYDTCWAFFCDTIVIDKPACTTQVSYVRSMNGAAVNFSATNTPFSVGDYTWDFGDGTFASGQNVNHIYKNSGTYRACVTFRKAIPNYPYDSCFAEFCDTIVIAKPECNATASFSYTKQDSTVNFNGNGGPSSLGQYHWYFGDGTTGTGKNPVHTYHAPGNYFVCLTYIQINPNTANDSCIAFYCDTITVDRSCQIVADFNYSRTGSSINFEGKASYRPADPYTLHGDYVWNFGDGSTGNGRNVSHAYASSGTYNVCLTFTQWLPNSNNSCTVIYCDSVTIVKSDCGITTGMSYEINDSTIFFSGKASFDPTDPYTFYGQYTWNFGDGHTATGINASHTYSASGNYTVCLTFRPGINNCNQNDTCITTTCSVVNITQNSPTGISNSSGTSALVLYPNPASGSITFGLSETAEIDQEVTETEVEILNSLGEVVLKDKNNNTLNIETLQPGLYIIQIKTGNKIFSKEFVKM